MMLYDGNTAYDDSSDNATVHKLLIQYEEGVLKEQWWVFWIRIMLRIFLNGFYHYSMGLTND